MYPKALRQGDTVAVLCPSTPTFREKVDKAEIGLKRLGLKPLMMPSCYAYHGHLAGRDSLRLKDLHDAFRSPDINGIINLKGGSGATRLLASLDYDLIAQNPKVFIGYSDITALHTAIHQMTGLVTYHGPMATSDIFINDENCDEYSLNSFKANIMTPGGYHGLLTNPPGESFSIFSEGICEGELIGGNLSLLTQTLGSPYEVDTKGKILFLEDVDEPIYKIDKMLTALALAGKFRDCHGILFGTFSGCKPEYKKSYGGEDLSLETVIEEVVVPWQKPILANLRAGHNFPQPTLAIGGKIQMNTYEKKLIFL
ncbi:LD-carboxypeptidase [Fusibacter paucivorans]|uniref:LD-carboxypeptidase n=1 Tax=Fusibacter paucivorans TaxID=76009 RepID=A0ABS5PU44_9FIRM|nr:LD-carboxypeptidase [Fusibacter paucivorans]MBS7528684.1 LD-carboxypeptidase [Fusibacter paucivorans]